MRQGLEKMGKCQCPLRFGLGYPIGWFASLTLTDSIIVMGANDASWLILKTTTWGNQNRSTAMGSMHP